MTHLLTQQQLSSLRHIFNTAITSTSASPAAKSTLTVSELTRLLNAAAESELSELEVQDLLNETHSSSSSTGQCGFEV